jgi:hypothetical protein
MKKSLKALTVDVILYLIKYKLDIKKPNKMFIFRWYFVSNRVKLWYCVNENVLIIISGKTDLESYMNENRMDCTYLQLRTKIMNEQNKRRKIVKKKLEKLKSQS